MLKKSRSTSLSSMRRKVARQLLRKIEKTPLKSNKRGDMKSLSSRYRSWAFIPKTKVQYYTRKPINVSIDMDASQIRLWALRILLSIVWSSSWFYTIFSDSPRSSKFAPWVNSIRFSSLGRVIKITWDLPLLWLW